MTTRDVSAQPDPERRHKPAGIKRREALDSDRFDVKVVRPSSETVTSEVRTGFRLLARVIAEAMSVDVSRRETGQDLRLLRLAEGDEGA